MDIRRPGVATEMANAVYPSPPSDFDDRHRDAFNTIMKSRAPAQWTESGIDVALAVELVNTLIDLEDERVQLKEEGTVLTGPKGGVIVNPRMAVCNSLRHAILRLEGRLSLGALGSRHSEMTQRGRTKAKEVDTINQTAAESGGLVPGMYRRDDADGLLPRFAPHEVKQ